MNWKKVAAGLTLSASLVGALAVQAYAQEYPTKPITLIVPFAAGGPTDVASRVVAQAVAEQLGQPVVVENRAGASSMIGATYVATAPNDGYTLLVGTTSTYATNPHVFKNIAYDSTKFTPIAMMVRVPLAFAVRKDMSVDTVKEFTAYAKGLSGPVQYGSAGAGTHSGLACFIAAREIGVEMLEIPYKGTTPALTDLMAGNIDALCDSVGTLSAPYHAGSIKIIGELDEVRSPAMPDVPTFVEAGYPDIVINNWFALTGPEGMDDAVVQKISKAVEAALSSKNVSDRLNAVGFVPQYMAPKKLGEFMAAEYARFDGVVAALGISLE